VTDGAGTELARPLPAPARSARELEARLLAGPRCELEVNGERRAYVLGDEVAIGRLGEGIVVPSPLVGRTHLVLRRVDRAPVVDVVGARTDLEGAGPAPSRLLVAGGLRLRLGGAVPVDVRPADPRDPRGDLLVDVAGDVHRVPLGPAALGGADVTLERAGHVAWVLLRTPPGARVTLGGQAIGAPLVLARGDEVEVEGGPRVRVGCDGPAGRRA
jgi:hypothetical protein